MSVFTQKWNWCVRIQHRLVAFPVTLFAFVVFHQTIVCNLFAVNRVLKQRFHQHAGYSISGRIERCVDVKLLSTTVTSCRTLRKYNGYVRDVINYIRTFGLTHTVSKVPSTEEHWPRNSACDVIRSSSRTQATHEAASRVSLRRLWREGEWHVLRRHGLPTLQGMSSHFFRRSLYLKEKKNEKQRQTIDSLHFAEVRIEGKEWLSIMWQLMHKGQLLCKRIWEVVGIAIYAHRLCVYIPLF